MPDWLRRPSLKACLAAIVFLVVVPTLGVVTMALLRAGESYRDASTQQLLETAHVVSQSVDNEMEVTARLVRGFADLHRHEVAGQHDHTALNQLVGGLFAIAAVRNGDVLPADIPLDVVAVETVKAAAAGKGVALSNITTIDVGGVPTPHLVFAVHDRETDGTDEVAVLIAKPTEMVRALARRNAAPGSPILAITDGTGRIIGRSVDGERFVGRPVPDWATLTALGTSSGSFRALTIEGNQIVFAFRKIPDTPGWAAVVGEPAARFDGRWQQPIMVMVVASGLTILAALVLAFLLAQRVLRPVSRLASRAREIALDRDAGVNKISVDVPPSFVAEFETLRTSLDQAEAVLHESLAESQAAERAALQSAEALQQAERLARIGSWTLDLATNEFTCSDMLYELNGADPEGPPLTAADLPRLLAPESYRRMQDAIADCIRTGEPYGLEVEHLRNDGHNFTAYVRGQAIRGPDGRAVMLSGTVQDISERTEQRERLAALADNLPSGVIFRLERDMEGDIRVAYVSAGIERLIGLSAADVMAHTSLLFDEIHADDQAALFKALEHSQETGTVLDHQFRVSARDGRTVWMHIRAALRPKPDGKLIWDGIARDMTHERAAGDALRAAKDAAEAAERTKGDFLATMSHEIRTPMNTVIGMTRLALQTNLDAKQRNYLEKINGSAGVLLGIINDVLDFSKIEAGGLTLEHAVFTLESVLESVSTVTALKAEEKGLELAFSVDPRTPGAFRGDPLRIGQVLTNLVGNAVKFTEKGDIVVTVRPRPDSAQSGRDILEFSVRDTGIGLSSDQIQGLFRPFTQAETDTSRKYGGTGLGLAICKRLVEMMGGDLRVDSVPGAGSTFTFTVSLEGLGKDELPASAGKVSRDLWGRRILIVDDNDNARTALSGMVAAFGMHAETASDGRAALAMLRAEAERGRPFEMVLLDWRMPEMDGIDVARQIRADARLLRMPAVLMVTAYGHEVVSKAVDDMGLEGMLLKPVTQSMMFNVIHGVLVAPGQASSARSRPASMQPGPATAYAALSGLRVLVVDDNALNREVATDFLNLVGVEVDTAVNGRDAIGTMERASYDAVLMDMHMPVMNGLEAVREIRRRPEWATLPVIALTAQARVEDHHASLEAGMTAHLTKPIDENALYGALMHVLSLAPREPAPPPADGRQEPPAATIDIDALLRRFGGNAQRVERLMTGFLRDFGSASEQFDAMLRRGDNGEIAELVHQIKGSAGYLGADDLISVAETLERAARRDDGEAVVAEADAFRTLLEACLAALEGVLAQMRTPIAPESSAAMPRHEALDLVDRIVPLVERGDFAARDLLETLRAGLSGTPVAGLADTIQDLYEDLDLVEATDALGRLRAELASANVAGAQR